MYVCMYVCMYMSMCVCIYNLLYAQNCNRSVSRDTDTLKLEVYGRILNCVSVAVELQYMY